VKTETPIVRMVDIYKSFGHVQALKGVNLELQEHEILALLGDNGAGKSTLIKILSGVFSPDKGEIYLYGRKVCFRSPREARAAGIETVHQHFSLVPLMNIWRNFFLGRELTDKYGILRRSDMEKISVQFLKTVGINVRSPNEAVSVLSGGERQAVSIGRAMYFGSKVLILDEPMNALSIREQRVVRNFILDARDKGLSIIFISHNVYHAYECSDRFVILERGEVIANIPKHEGLAPEDIAEIIATGKSLSSNREG